MPHQLVWTYAAHILGSRVPGVRLPLTAPESEAPTRRKCDLPDTFATLSETARSYSCIAKSAARANRF